MQGSCPATRWIPAFIVLFVAYQGPEALRTPALMLAFLPVAWLVARALGMGTGRAYALEWNRRCLLLLSGGFLLAIVAKAAALAVGTRLAVYSPGTAAVSAGALSDLAWLLPWTFVPSIAEDMLTRGFWARIPDIRWTASAFILFSALLYVLNHIFRLANGPVEWFMLFCFGLAYAAALWKTGSLWAAVGLHWGWNFAGPALGIAWPYEIADADGSKILSAVVHLVLLAIILFLPKRR